MSFWSHVIAWTLRWRRDPRSYSLTRFACDAARLFEGHTTWLGFRHGTLLRAYMYDFIELLAPHLPRKLVQAAEIGDSGSSQPPLRVFQNSSA
jgi:hypothetical protein